MSASSSSTFDLSRVRSRIVGHVELLPSEILDHPGQAWDHPDAQAKALYGILSEVGIVDEILVYKSERAGGKYVTPDGHLRKSLDPRKPWPCTVLDLTDEEADYVLATKDPVGMMKLANAEAVDALLASVTTSNADVLAMFDEMRAKTNLMFELDRDDSAAEGFADGSYNDVSATEFTIVFPAERDDEHDFKTALAELTERYGVSYKTRVLRED